MQSLIGSAKGVVTFTESHFFDKCFGSLHRTPMPLDVDKDSVTKTLTRFVSENTLDEKLFADVAKANKVGEISHAFIRALDKVANQYGACVWVEKTPDHLFRIPMISTAAPDAEFVHILRAPAETIDSLQKASVDWGSPRGWFAFAAKWWLSLRISEKYIHCKHHTHVCYEDLLVDGHLKIKDVFYHLRLPWGEEVMVRYRETASKVVAEGESWKANNLREIVRHEGENITRSVIERLVLGVLERKYQCVRARILNETS